MTSPITRGWPILHGQGPEQRAASITTATAMKNAARVLPNSRCLVASILSGCSAGSVTSR